MTAISSSTLTLTALVDSLTIEMRPCRIHRLIVAGETASISAADWTVSSPRCSSLVMTRDTSTNGQECTDMIRSVQNHSHRSTDGIVPLSARPL